MLAIVEQPLRAVVFDRNEIIRIVPDWNRLAADAAEDNVYYAPGYALPLLTHVEANVPVQFLTVWDNDRLVGLLPFVKSLIGAAAWKTLYTFDTTPLVSKDSVSRTVKTLVAAMRACQAGEWIFRRMAVSGPVGSAMAAELAMGGSPRILVNRFERAGLEAGSDFDEHMKQHVSTGQRKNLAKRLRQLSAEKKVEYRTFTSGAELDCALADFFRLEASGWKGERGTALASAPNTKSFAEEIMTPTAACKARIDMLFADDVAIAGVLTAVSGDTGFTLKSAYDESYRNFGVGLLLEVELLRSYLANPWAKRLDASTDGTHVIDGFWPERKEVGDMLVSLAPAAAALRLRGLGLAMAAKSSVKSKVKKAIGMK